MSHLTVNVPDWVLREAEELARRNNIPLEQFIALAMAEKVSALLTIDDLRARGEQASLEQFREVLANVPAIEPDEGDRLD